MQYINPNTNPSGAYSAPQSTPGRGLIPISDTIAAEVIKSKGFGDFEWETVAGVLTVTAWIPGIVPELEPEKEAEPTAQDDTDAMLVDHEYRITLLELGLTE